MTDSNNQPVFSIERTYVKDISLEVPHAPEIFLVQENPTMEINIALDHRQVEDEFYETTVTATITANLNGDKENEKRVLFVVEAVQGGIFHLKNIPEEDIAGILNVTCPNILFPYVREVLTDLTVRAGFPPVYIAPLDFASMYQQQLENQKHQDA